jgi:hypothetical protein
MRSYGRLGCNRMTIVQIAVLLIAAAGFVLACILSSKRRIRVWVLLVAVACGLALAALSKDLLNRLTTLRDMAMGLAFVCSAGPLLFLAFYFFSKIVEKTPEPRNGRVLRMSNAPAPLKAGASRNGSLLNAQNTEVLRLVRPEAPQSAPAEEAPPSGGAEAAGEPAEPIAETPVNEPAAEPAEEREEWQAWPPAAEQAPGQALPEEEGPVAEQAAPEAEALAERQSEEDLMIRLEEGFRMEKERMEKEEEEKRSERERLAQEQERRKREERLALEEEVRRKEKERAEKEAEKRRRDQERRIRREEERRVKEEQKRSAGEDAVNEAQRLSQRIREERERIAMEERLKQEAAAGGAEKRAAPVQAAKKAEEQSWEIEAARMARELEERKIEQQKAAADEKQWLEQQEKKVREAEMRRLEQERKAREEERRRLEQEKKAREAEERRLEQERREKELLEALEKRIAEAEACLAKGRELLGGGASLEAIPWLEKAARLETTNRIRLEAGIAILEALEALGWKAEALKKMQAMKAGLVIDAESKKKLGEIASRLIG